MLVPHLDYMEYGFVYFKKKQKKTEIVVVGETMVGTVVWDSLGLPARYTSGYFYGDEEFSERELHAWAEVYLPGGGWRGYDPTAGLVVSDQHVAVASGPTWNLTAPTTGNFRGTGANSSLTRQISRGSNPRTPW